jgi:hypothetical protein
MKFNLTIDCDNAAFHPDPTPEIERILAKLAKEVQSHLGFYNSAELCYAEKALFDINGNRVGTARMTGKCGGKVY